MLFIVGVVVVFIAVFAVFGVTGGRYDILVQPGEFFTITGAAVGAYLISNRMGTVKHTLSMLKKLMGQPRYNKDSYLELLSLLYTSFKLAKTKGMLALEQHVENPRESQLFQRFPTFMNDESSLTFLCDYLRLLTLGTDNPHEVEALMDEEIETHLQESMHVPSALATSADGLPALGIVAAVLGVIKVMGHITEPASVLGELIGGALTGTLMGVLFSYGFVGPIANFLKNEAEAEIKYMQCMKAGVLAHMQGYAPAVSVEFARKALLSDVRPTFYEVEQTVSALPPV
jgi:chemotaxis protein MotA